MEEAPPSGLKRKQDGAGAPRAGKKLKQVRAVHGAGAAGNRHAAAAQHETSVNELQHALHVIS